MTMMLQACVAEPSWRLTSGYPATEFLRSETKLKLSFC